MKRKIFSLLCIISMCMSLVTPAIAKDVNDVPTTTFDKVYEINPMYADVISESDLDEMASKYEVSAASEEEIVYETDINKVIEEIRDNMTKREETFSVYYTQHSDLESNYFENWINQAFAENENPEQGDYLRWHFAGAQGQRETRSYSDGKKEYKVTFSVSYHSTLEQEKKVDTKMQDVLTELQVDSLKTDYEKVKAIYDYICDNVIYDDGLTKHSAYEALINGTSVCQGYASLLYRMLRESGISTRIITGIGNEGPHAWNIIKLGAKYYLADSTWDINYKENDNYQFFLRGSNTFERHTSYDEYLTDEFKALYPVSENDYTREEEEPHEHTYGEWIVDAEATCTTAGSKHKECSGCGDIVIEELPALGHEWNSNYAIDRPASCKEDGSKSIHCKKCDATKDVTVIPKGEHSYGEWTITKEPTCTETGTRSATCTACGDTVEESVPKLNHTEVIDKGYASTCISTGLTDGSHCSVCNEVIEEQIVIPVADHEWNNSYTIDKPATCTEEGSKSIHCKNCSATKNSKVIPLIDHSYDEGVTDPKATTTADGVKTYICTNGCGETTTEVIPKISSQKLSYIKTVYNGSPKNPSVTVEDADGNELIKGTDYDVTYASGSTKVGRYKVTITYKGDYEGSKSIYFTIVPKAPTSASANLSPASQTKGYDDIKFSWKKSTGATGYLVYYKKASASSWSGPKSTSNTSYTMKDLFDGVKYSFKVVPYYKTSSGTTKYYSTAQYKTASAYTLKKLSAPTLSKSGEKVKVKWTNINGESGYQISKSTSKTGTSILNISIKADTTSKTVSAIKGKTYYYKVRAYKLVDGKKIYAPWSAVKAFKR